MQIDGVRWDYDRHELIADGIVHGRKVACPLHNWIINLEDGEATGADKGCVRTFPVKLENGRIYLDMGVAAAP